MCDKIRILQDAQLEWVSIGHDGHPIEKEITMASSALSHALEDLLDMMEDENAGDSEATRAMMDNARYTLDAYKESNSSGNLAGHIRIHLAQLIQYVNQEMPELVGSRELRDANELLSQPHLPASDIATPREPALTPNEPGPVVPDPEAPGEGDVSDDMSNSMNDFLNPPKKPNREKRGDK